MDEKKQYKLSEFLAQVKIELKQNFSSYYYVIAATSGSMIPSSGGHIYLDLIEKNGNDIRSKIRLSVFSNNSYLLDEFFRKTGLKFGSGMEVLIKVQIDLHERWGFGLILKDIDYSYTLAKVQDERQKTLLRLESEKIIRFIEPGKYLTVNNQLELNPVIQRIALISAKNSEGYNDFVKALSGNSHSYKFEISDFYATMAGEASSKSIIMQLNSIRKQSKEFDAVAIVRGGGDDIGFLCFDEYELSKCVATFPLPIITGIGHERNKSIVDLVANSFTMTPTMAAKNIIDHNWKFEQMLLSLQRELAVSGKDLLVQTKDELKDLQNDLSTFTKQLISEQKQWLAGIVKDLKNFSPENTLARGFALLLVDGKVIKDAKTLKPGTKLKTITKSDIIESNILKIEKRNGEIKL